MLDKHGRVAGVYTLRLQAKDVENVAQPSCSRSSDVLIADGGFTHTVTDGPLLVAAGVAALVGLLGFLSPCVLPLVPGYLSYVAGLSGTDARQPSQRRMLAGALLFVLGFSVIFVAQGIIFGSLGAAIRDHALVIERVLGVVTIVMGIVFLGGFGFLQREFKIHRLPGAGLAGAPLLGAAFGLAWTPVPHADLRRREQPRPHRGQRGPRRVPAVLLLPRPRHPVPARRARGRLGHRGAGVRAPARAGGQHGRRRVPHRHRSAAGHRRSGTSG